jgi:predicted transcriptional regulator of viral defense system
MSIKPDYHQLYEIAESQAGYFTAAQARKVSFSWERLSINVKTGKFLRVAQGVYRLVHFPSSPFEDYFVMWLKTGANAVISHESALAVYDLSDVLPGEIHIIVPRTASRRRKGMHMHTNRLRPGEVTTREGLPVTTVARTIADAAASHLAEDQVRQAVREALVRGLTTPEELLIQARQQKGRAERVIIDELRIERAT